MTFQKLLGKNSILSILLLVAFLLGADRGQTSSSSITAFNQKVTTTTPIFHSNINSKLRPIDQPWLTAQRQSRVALVIGNGSYEEAPLRNPVNDANDIAAALKRLGFELIDNRALLDLNKREMNDAIDKFRERLRQGGVGTFYYAGHGVAIEGVNYLIPINADLDAKEDVEYEAIPLRKVINNMEATETQFNFIIVDACRDNPIYRQWSADRRSGRRPQGFAKEKENLARGTLIFYATRYGRTARDGKGRNSTFTAHLLEHIETRNLRVVDLMSKVADGVEKETDFEQVPWQEGSIRGGPFFLSRIEDYPTPPSPQPGLAPPAVPPTPEQENPEAELLLDQIVALYDRGDYQRAIEKLNQYKNPDLNNEQAGLELAETARELAQFQQYEAALQRAKVATLLAPDRYQTWFILGILYVEGEEIERGITALDRALALAPEEKWRILFALGGAYLQTGEYQAAIARIEEGLRLKPDDLAGFFLLGSCLLKLGQFSQAISAYEKVLSLEENFLPALNNIGLVQYEQGNTERAIQNWEKAIAIDPEYPEPRLALAVALYAQGIREQGLELGEAALAIDSRYADWQFLQENLWGERLLQDAKAFLRDLRKNNIPPREETRRPLPLTPLEQPGTTLISKATGVDYTRLRDLLASGNWREADLETTRTMLQAAGAWEKERWLREEDIDNFSCEDLRIIDQLWLDSSQGKFGFSVQKDIFQNLGGTREYNREVWENFASQVGWFVSTSIPAVSGKSFNDIWKEAEKEALHGQLPVQVLENVGWLHELALLKLSEEERGEHLYYWLYVGGGHVGNGVRALEVLSRAEDCNL